MNNEQDPFRDYYEESINKLPKGETAKEIIARMEAEVILTGKEKNVPEDANTIRGPINAFIKNMNALIVKAFTEETEKKTRTDLIVTMVVGGMAYAVASLYFFITKKHKVKMSADEFEITFIGMYHSALKDIGKSEGQS